LIQLSIPLSLLTPLNSESAASAGQSLKTGTLIAIYSVVRVNQLLSESFNVKRGVKQGSVILVRNAFVKITDHLFFAVIFSWDLPWGGPLVVMVVPQECGIPPGIPPGIAPHKCTPHTWMPHTTFAWVSFKSISFCYRLLRTVFHLRLQIVWERDYTFKKEVRCNRQRGVSNSLSNSSIRCYAVATGYCHRRTVSRVVWAPRTATHMTTSNLRNSCWYDGA